MQARTPQKFCINPWQPSDKKLLGGGCVQTSDRGPFATFSCIYVCNTFIFLQVNLPGNSAHCSQLQGKSSQLQIISFTEIQVFVFSNKRWKLSMIKLLINVKIMVVKQVLMFLFSKHKSNDNISSIFFSEIIHNPSHFRIKIHCVNIFASV